MLTNICDCKTINCTKWSTIFGVSLDRIWGRQNDLVFRNTWTNTEGLVNKATALIKDIGRSTKFHNVIYPDLFNGSKDASEV